MQALMIGLLLACNLFSQDTLYTKKGHVIAGKVTEINDATIKFKKASNLDGPTYVINKEDVVMITYKNGAKDVFSEQDNTTGANQSQANNNNSTYLPQTYVYPRPNVNVVIGAPSPFYYYNPWGWRSGWGYRPYGYYGGNFGGYHSYHGGGGYHGGGYHGGYHGHHR